LRWLIHHSELNAERNDRVIIGASTFEHLRHNLTAVTEGPLPTEVLAAIDDAALRPNRSGRTISRGFRFSVLERSEPREGARSFVRRHEHLLSDSTKI
jgi:hypothetical protein